MLLALLLTMPALAGQPVCWSPEALAAQPGEERITHGGRVVLPDVSPAGVMPPAQPGTVRRVHLREGAGKLIALTFDLCETLGETAGYDGAIIDVLRREGIAATFFAGGKWLTSHPERAAQLMADPLFEVGTHGWAHADMRALSGDALRRDLTLSQDAWRATRDGLSRRSCLAENAQTALATRRPALFRFPYGTCNAEALAATAAAGQTAIQWDVVSGDPWPVLTPQRLASGVIDAVRPGSIVVAHANGRGWHTREALPAIVTALRAKGFRFVTVSALLAAGAPEIAQTCFERKPGDNDRRDVGHPLRSARAIGGK